MLLQSKLNDIQRQIQFCIKQCQSLVNNAYPNLKYRLQLKIEELHNCEMRAISLAEKISQYRRSDNHIIDTWQQLYYELVMLNVDVHSFRVSELSNYLNFGKTDIEFTNFLTKLHKEIGWDDIKPCVSLYQSRWFVVYPEPSDAPLYLLPISITQDNTEIALIFHEIGHVMFRRWGDDFMQKLLSVVTDTFSRKRKEIKADYSDPNTRAKLTEQLIQYQQLFQFQLEELVCDIIGGLVGGTAFCISSVMALWLTAEPFQLTSPIYPPLDVRMRVASLILNHLDVEDSVSQHLRDGWSQVHQVYPKPPHFDFFFDDKYIRDLIYCVEDYLSKKSIALYNGNKTGIRLKLNKGIELLISDPNKFETWRKTPLLNIVTD